MIPELWCAIPVYNNVGTITDIARRCREQVEHVIIVDDGSTDADLRELLKELDVAVIRHDVNQGKGIALLTAFRHAAQRGAKFIVTVDGDGQHFPEDISRFLPHLQSNTILIGSRDEVVGAMPSASVFGRDFSDFWICVETGREVKDTQSGFRVYPLPIVLDLQLASRHYNLEMEIITRAIWAGLAVKDVPIRVWYPERDERVSSFDPVRDNLRISLLHLRLVLRQLLPIPRRKLVADLKEQSHFLTVNSGSLGLAVAAGISILMGIVLWPWGWVPVLYLAIRLHLNKLMVLACLAICALPIIPRWCIAVGQMMVTDHRRLAWIVGSHLIALPASVIGGGLVYVIAKRNRR